MTAGPALGLHVALDAPVAFIRDELRALIGVSAIAHVASSLPALVVVPFIDVQSLLDPSKGFDTVTVVSVLAAVAVGAVVGVPMSLAVYEACRLRLDGEPITARALVRTATRPTLILAAIAETAVVAAGLLMCAVPGIVAAVMLALLVPVLLCEDLGVVQGARRCVELARHRLGGAGVRAAWLVVLIFAVWTAWAVFINMLGSVVSAVYAMAVAMDAVSKGTFDDPSAVVAPWWLTTVVSVMSLALRAVTDLYPPVALLLLYRGIREEREGSALLAAIRERAAGSAGGP